MIIKNNIITGFNRGAATYTQVAHLQARVAEKLAQKLPGITAENILEIGCGTGLLTHHLLRLFPHADFLVTDISPSMLKQCHAHINGVANVAFECVDGEQLAALPCFDLITSSMTMHWFSDFAVSLQNMQQKVVPGGRLIFAMLGNQSLLEWKTMCDFFQYPSATPHFPSLQFLRNQFPEMTFHVEMMHESYPDAYTFLTTLKSLGATATRKDYVSLSPQKMRRLLRHFNTPIVVSYEVIYGDYQAL